MTVRANDTAYPFRPGTDFAWLTGHHDPDAVLIVRPGGEATLYMRPRSPRDGDEFFRSRHGELWIGRRQMLAETATELGIDTAHLDTLGAALDDLARGRTRVLRDLDPAVDRAVRGTAERDGELARTLSELRLVKDEWEVAQLRDAIGATVRGFEDVARVLPADRPVRERLVEGVFGLRARHDGNALGYSSIVGAGAHATTLHWIRNTGATTPGQLLLMDMGVENHHLYTADDRAAIPAALQDAGVRHDVVIYPDTPHGFFCDERDTYRPAAAADAWQRLTALLAETLSPSRPAPSPR